MATKDWGKTPVSGRLMVFDNVKSEERIIIDYIKYGLESKNKEPYFVFIDGEYPKSFKTKSQALSFAKKYMRNN